MTALDNVANGMLYTGALSRERREAARVALERVGLGHRLDAPAGAAVGRRAPAGRDRAGDRQAAGDHPRRRADRQPRLDVGRRGRRPAARAGVRRRDARADHPRPRDRCARSRGASRCATARSSPTSGDDRATSPRRPGLRRGARGLRCSVRRWLRACAPAGCAPRCRRSGSRSGSARWSPSSACRPPARPSLLAEIDALGTNLLTVTPGPDVPRRTTRVLPDAVGADDRRTCRNVDSERRRLPGLGRQRATAARTCPRARPVASASTPPATNLPRRSGASMAARPLPGRGQRPLPEVVLGAQAATRPADPQRRRSRPGVPRQHLVQRGRHPQAGAARLLASTPPCSSRCPVAERLFQTQPNPSEIYVRADVNARDRGRRTCSRRPPIPSSPTASRSRRPSDALEARAAAKGQFTTLLLGLGAVALLVGRDRDRQHHGHLRARAAWRDRPAPRAGRHPAPHHASSSSPSPRCSPCSAGSPACALGAGATEVYAVTRNEPFVVPLYALIAARRRRPGDRRAGRPVPRGQGRPAQPDRGAAGGLKRGRRAVLLRRVDTRRHSLGSCREGARARRRRTSGSGIPRAVLSVSSPLRCPIDCDEVRLVASGSLRT